MLKGKLTYIGIAGMAISAVFGWLGIGDCTPEQVVELGEAACQGAEALALDVADKVGLLLSTVVGLYGRYRASKDAPK